MKLFRQFIFVVLSLLFLLASCTIEKRVYMSGYHIELNSKKHKACKQELTSSENLKKAEEDNIAKIKSVTIDTNKIDNHITLADNNITASADNQRNILTQNRNNGFVIKHKVNSLNEKNNSVSKKTFNEIPQSKATRYQKNKRTSKSKIEAKLREINPAKIIKFNHSKNTGSDGGKFLIPLLVLTLILLFITKYWWIILLGLLLLFLVVMIWLIRAFNEGYTG